VIHKFDSPDSTFNLKIRYINRYSKSKDTVQKHEEVDLVRQPL
jgi:hypothetical protein